MDYLSDLLSGHLTYEYKLDSNNAEDQTKINGKTKKKLLQISHNFCFIAFLLLGRRFTFREELDRNFLILMMSEAKQG